ncbi:MAG: HD domain-containing protein [Desulfarculus sp.]|nr:MAG: HD domain-containing protein [Desulfarculus sp.]
MERHNSCLNTRAIIDYVERHYGSPEILLEGLEDELEGLENPIEFLRDSHNWVSSDLVKRMYDNARRMTGDRRVVYSIGFESVTHQRLGYIQQILLRAWASPKVAIKRLETINKKFNRTKDLELMAVGPDRAVVRLHWYRELELSQDFCLMNQGVYSAIPTIWGLPPAKVEETHCQFDGDPYCEFEIHWQNPSTLRRFQMLLHNRRSLLSESLAEIEHDKQLLENKYWEVQALNRRLMAKIEQILALQQASGAILSELDYQKLIPNVLKLFLRTIDYKRSMIMLVDHERNVLKYVAGVGMDPMDLQPLDGYAVPLDRAENLLARVVLSGQPVISQNAGQLHLNPENVIIRNYRPQSIVILPLTAQGKVIGILAADRDYGEGAVTSMDRDYLEVFANQVALAIENARMYRNLKESFLSTVKSLAQALEAKDAYTRGHSERVTRYSVRLAQCLKLPAAQVEQIERMGMLHDVGKIGIDRQILNKVAALSEEDLATIRLHTSWGHSIITPLNLSEAEMAIVRHHHERYDGSGYPDGLQGEAIPLAVRLVTICDSFDAMTSDRPYRSTLGLGESLRRLEAGAGSQFDPQVVESFVKMVREGRFDDIIPGDSKAALAKRHLNLV